MSAPNPAAQQASLGAMSQPSQTSRSRAEDPAKVREWARANGYDVKDRGRINADILTAYKKRNTKKVETPETETETETETPEA